MKTYEENVNPHNHIQLVKIIFVHLNLFIYIKFLIYNFALYNDSIYKLFNQIDRFCYSIQNILIEEINENKKLINIFLNIRD